MAENEKKEILEAVEAGEKALESLKKAQSLLNSAGNWGIVDIMGGGLYTDMIKHSKIASAKQYMEAARQDLRSFQKELDDVDEYLSGIDINQFFTFTDFFFDGFIADFCVQTKINEEKQKVAEAVYQVQSIVNRLKQEIE